MATLRDDLPHPRLAQPLPRSLLIRWSNNPENHRALLHLACGFMTWRLATPTTYRDRFLAGRPAVTGLSSRSDCCRIVRIRERETGSGERDHRSARYAGMLPSARGMDRELRIMTRVIRIGDRLHAHRHTFPVGDTRTISQTRTIISGMERTGIEPVTPSLQSWCSPS